MSRGRNDDCASSFRTRDDACDRNALLPVTTVIGLQTGLLLSGAVLTETVFAFPGMGSYLRDAIFNRDYPVLQGGILFLALVFVFVNLIVDISYAIINPRIRYS